MGRGFRIVIAILILAPWAEYAEAVTMDRVRLLQARRTLRVPQVVAPESVPQPLETAFIPYSIEHGLLRVTRTGAIGNTREAVISAARNEFEPFQLIVRAPDGSTLQGVDAQTTDLLGPGLISRTHVVVHRQHYVPVRNPSPGSPHAPAEWPDALVPLLHPDSGQPLRGGRIQAAPFDVPAGTNQPLLVEVYVPAATPPGTYTGHVVLSAAGYTHTEVPLRLRVRPFTLPQRSRLRSTFTSYAETYRAAEHLGLPYGHPEREAMARRFNAFLLQHRISANTPEGTAPYVDRSSGQIDTSYSHPQLWSYLEELQATTWTVPVGPDWPWADPTGADRDKAVTYLREMGAYLKAHGWLDRAVVQLDDEPDSAAAYSTIRTLADLVHSVRPEYRVLVTEQPQPQNPAWGNLEGAVDIWVPLTSWFEEASASAALGRGEEVWSYTEGGAPPAWLIDQPLLNPRLFPWINWRYGQTGILYWTPWYWEEVNPWDDAGTYTVPWGTYNGNGCLVYPGNDVGYTNGPVASLRLKALRDGMEDYEYLALLADLGESSAADGEALAIGTSWSSPNPDPAALLNARERIADRIEALLATPASQAEALRPRRR